MFGSSGTLRAAVPRVRTAAAAKKRAAAAPIAGVNTRAARAAAIGMGETAKDDRSWRAVPMASYAADNVADLIEELEERDEENTDAMEEISHRIGELENVVGAKGDKGDIADRVDELETAVGQGGDKGDIADRVDELETAVENAESEKEGLEGRVYEHESSIARIEDRLARLERG